MSRSIIRWSATLAVALSATPALAQGVPLAPDGLVSGEVAGSGNPASVSLRLQPGQSVQLDAIPAPNAPAGLDMLLKVYDSEDKLVGEDDDGGGSLNPRVQMTSAEGGVYRVDVDVLGDGGPFSLIARGVVIEPEVVTELQLSDGKAERSVTFPDEQKTLFSFSGRRGEVYVISLIGDNPGADERADPMLEVFEGSGTTGETLWSDDDSLGELNSRVVGELPANGTYTVRVSSLSGAGAAELSIARMEVRPAPVGNLAYGTPATASFGADSPFVTDNGSRRLLPFAMFRLPASPAPGALAGRNEVIEIRARSDALDPYLEVGFETPFGFMPVLQNDDTDGLDALVVVEPAELDEADAADWWSKLRVRVTVPTSSTGEVAVTAARTPG